MKLSLFKWKQFEPEVVLWAVRWNCQFPISYRDLQLMMEERGLKASHTTIMRWVHQLAPQLEKRTKRYLKRSTDSWILDETYIKIKGKWKYLYRAVDSMGHTLDWMLSAERSKKVTKKFFKRLLKNVHCRKPRVLNVDKNPAYPPAFDEYQHDDSMPKSVSLRQVKYLNNIQEQDHRFIKRRSRQSQWFQSFSNAKKTIAGYETLHMIRKGQVKYLAKGSMLAQKQFVENLFGIAT